MSQVPVILGPLRLWSIQKFNDRFGKMLAFADRPAGQRVTEEDRGCSKMDSSIDDSKS